MTMSTETIARLEAQMLIVAEDYPTTNLILLCEPEGIPIWGLVLTKETPAEQDPDLPTVGIALPAAIYDAVDTIDLEIIRARFEVICHRPIELSPEDAAAFRVSAKAALAEACRRGLTGEMWMCSAGAPLGQADPRPFTVTRDTETGNFWIAVPPRWLVAESLGFNMEPFMDMLAAEVLEERSRSAPLN